MNALVALGVENPTIDAMGSFQKGAATQLQFNAEKQKQAKIGMQNLSAMALGVMGGKMDGEPDPAKWDQAIDYLTAQSGGQGDYGKYKGRSDLAPIIARAGLDALQQLGVARDERDHDFALEKFSQQVANANRSFDALQAQRATSNDLNNRKFAYEQEQDVAAANAPPEYQMLTPEQVAQAGLSPGSYQRGANGKIYSIGKGGTNVTVNNGSSPMFPKPKAGFGYLRDQNGNVKIGPDSLPMQGRLPGGPEDTSKQDGIKSDNTMRAGQVVSEDIGRVLSMVNEHPIRTTGFWGDLLKNLAGSEAHDVESLIETIGANVGFDRLQQMRDGSKTGGALGAINKTEMSLLQSALGNLEQSQSQDQLVHNLKRLQGIYETIMTKASAYPNAQQFGFGGAPQEPGQQDTDLSDDDLVKKYLQ